MINVLWNNLFQHAGYDVYVESLVINNSYIFMLAPNYIVTRYNMHFHLREVYCSALSMNNILFTNLNSNFLLSLNPLFYEKIWNIYIQDLNLVNALQIQLVAHWQLYLELQDILNSAQFINYNSIINKALEFNNELVEINYNKQNQIEMIKTRKLINSIAYRTDLMLKTFNYRF